MKRSPLSKIAVVLISVLSSSILSFGQFADLEKNMDCKLNTQAIKENKIKSLMVYADFNENGILKRGSQGGKTREVEFDDSGNVLYSLTSSNGGNLPFIYYGSGSKLESKEYDENGHVTFDLFESSHYKIQSSFSYDERGNKLSEEYNYDEKVIYTINFEWKRDKLVNHEFHPKDGNINASFFEFDKKGRIIKSGWAEKITTFQYEQKGDTLFTTSKYLRADTLVWTVKKAQIDNQSYMCGFVQLDHKNELMKEIKVKIDGHGNATYLYSNDHKDTYLDEEFGRVSYPPSTYEIQNFYNDKNLLVKREFYYSREDVGSPKLIKIERYIYDNEALPYKFEKGKMMERIENY